MGARAIIDIDDDTGRHTHFWSPWASPHFQIPHLARFIHETDASGVPVTVAAYRAFATSHPGTLPTDEIDAPVGADTAAPSGDLDYHYRLRLSTATGGVRYTVAERSRHRRTARWHTTVHLSTRRELYRAAADMCDVLARNSQRLADRNNGTGLPGFPDPDRWRTEAAVFTDWHDACELTWPEATAPSGRPASNDPHRIR